jgi:hypothetical protein
MNKMLVPNEYMIEVTKAAKAAARRHNWKVAKTERVSVKRWHGTRMIVAIPFSVKMGGVIDTDHYFLSRNGKLYHNVSGLVCPVVRAPKHFGARFMFNANES